MTRKKKTVTHKLYLFNNLILITDRPVIVNLLGYKEKLEWYAKIEEVQILLAADDSEKHIKNALILKHRTTKDQILLCCNTEEDRDKWKAMIKKLQVPHLMQVVKKITV